MEIKDAVVIVTGASSGIGEAIARLLAARGAKVALVARSQAKLESLTKELANSLAVRADMTKTAQIKAMVKRVKDHYGKIDILVNCAGQGYDAPVENINLDTFYRIFDLDLVGPIIAMQQVIPIMRKQGAGAIVNISSGTALMLLPNMSAYAGLKQALVKISLTARAELERDKISVSVVYPYITATNFEKNTIKEMPKRPEGREVHGHYQPPPADSAEFVAEKTLEGIQRNEAEIVVHAWMKKA